MSFDRDLLLRLRPLPSTNEWTSLADLSQTERDRLPYFQRRAWAQIREPIRGKPVVRLTEVGILAGDDDDG